jgi:protein-tyrosine phosphatase
LVSGRRGCNRSAGLVIALVMRHAGLTLREAVEHVAVRRNIHLAAFVKEALQKQQQISKNTVKETKS